MSEKIAVYPGSFNPVHPGHLHVIRQAAQVFDRVIVLIAENPEKSYPINPVLRMKWIKEMTTGYDWSGKVSVQYTPEALVDFCFENNIGYIVRGLRNGTDLEFEKTQMEYNYCLSESPASLQYVFFTTPAHSEHMSSSGVRQFVKYGTAGKLINLYFLSGWGNFPDTVKEIYDRYKGV